MRRTRGARLRRFVAVRTAAPAAAVSAIAATGTGTAIAAVAALSATVVALALRRSGVRVRGRRRRVAFEFAHDRVEALFRVAAQTARDRRRVQELVARHGTAASGVGGVLRRVGRLLGRQRRRTGVVVAAASAAASTTTAASAAAARAPARGAVA